MLIANYSLLNKLLLLFDRAKPSPENRSSWGTRVDPLPPDSTPKGLYCKTLYQTNKREKQFYTIFIYKFAQIFLEDMEGPRLKALDFQLLSFNLMYFIKKTKG